MLTQKGPSPLTVIPIQRNRPVIYAQDRRNIVRHIAHQRPYTSIPSYVQKAELGWTQTKGRHRLVKGSAITLLAVTVMTYGYFQPFEFNNITDRFHLVNPPENLVTTDHLEWMQLTSVLSPLLRPRGDHQPDALLVNEISSRLRASTVPGPNIDIRLVDVDGEATCSNCGTLKALLITKQKLASY